MCEKNCKCTSCTSGLNGYNAYTYLTASFVQPAYGANVTISVNNSRPNTGSWAAVGQIIFIENGGYYEVVTEGSNSLVVKNLANLTDYTGNTAVGNTVVSGGIISPAGLQSNQSPIIPTSGRFEPTGTDALPIGPTTGYATFFSRFIQNYLQNNGDSVEIEFIFSPFPLSTGQVDSTRISLNGVVLHELTNTAIDATNKVWYKCTIIRNSSTLITYKSEFKMLASDAASVTDEYDVITDQYTYYNTAVNIGNFNTVTFLVEVDISTTGNSCTLNYLNFKYVPLIS